MAELTRLSDDEYDALTALIPVRGRHISGHDQSEVLLLLLREVLAIRKEIEDLKGDAWPVV